MKITGGNTNPSAITSKASIFSPDSDLPVHNPKTRKKPRCSGTGVKLQRTTGAPTGKRSRPETPLLQWKFAEKTQSNGCAKEEHCGRENSRKGKAVVSARRLAAELWRLQLPEVQVKGGEKMELKVKSELGHLAEPFHGNHSNSRVHNSQIRGSLQSPPSVSGPRNDFPCKLDPSFKFLNSAMEGATKWDPISKDKLDEVNNIYGGPKQHDDQENGSVIASLQAELEQARSRSHELETERKSSKKKLEHFLKKLSEERAAWRSREHEKVRAIIDDVKADLSRERKNRQRLEIVNSKLVNELADTKLSAKRYMQDYEKERKARELIEEVCDELAKEIGEDKAEVEALKRESMKLREEVEDERRMLQMAEVWREERVQMKLIDAKVTLEKKYSEMSRLIAILESFLSSKDVTLDAEEMRKAEILRQAAASVDIEDIKEFTYEPPHPDEIFSIFDDVNFGEPMERGIEQCDSYTPASHASKVHTVSPDLNLSTKHDLHRRSSACKSGELEDDVSDWETVSNLEDQGSSYSPDGSDPYMKKNLRDSNASRSGTDWEGNATEGTHIAEIGEVCSIPIRQLKKASSISRLWRSSSNNGENFKIISFKNGRQSNGRISSGALISPDHGSGNGGLSPSDLAEQWSSPDSENPHLARGMKGCIEWPRSAQKNSLKEKLLEARMESQKIQLRQVLKQKI